MSQPHKHSAATWSLTAAAALVLYFLMPIPVMAVLTKVYGTSIPEPVEDALEIIFYPVVYAVEEWEPVGNFYEAAFQLFGVDP